MLLHLPCRLNRTIIWQTGSSILRSYLVAINLVTRHSRLTRDWRKLREWRWDSRTLTCRIRGRMLHARRKRKTDYNGARWFYGVIVERSSRFFPRREPPRSYSEIYWDTCGQVWRSGLSWVLSSSVSTPVIQEELLDEVLMDVARFRAEAINQPDVNRDALLLYASWITLKQTKEIGSHWEEERDFA